MTIDIDSSYHFSKHIAATDLRPDIVMWSDAKKEIIFAELRVCYETNFGDAHKRKMRKYLGLAEEADERGYRATIVPVQVGSRGMVEVESFERLQPYLSMSHNKEWRSFLTDIARKSPKISGQNETRQIIQTLSIYLYLYLSIYRFMYLLTVYIYLW